MLTHIFATEKIKVRFSLDCHSYVLFLRFNIAADLIDQAKRAGELGLAGMLVWMRFMATRQLIWNKNYNVKPRYYFSST